MKASKEQYEAYVKVQKSGNFNMFGPDAMLETGLDKETFFDIIKHYALYAEKYEGDK